MHSSSVDPVAFYVELARCASLEDCSRLFERTIATVGFSVFACGEIDLSQRERNVLFIAHWPPEWLRYCRTSVFVERDPILNALAISPRPFSFGEIVRDPRYSTSDREAIRSAAKHGWARGLAVPSPRGGARYGLVTMLGQGKEGAERENAALFAISELLLARVRAFSAPGAFAMPPAGLSPREVEVVHLVALGASESEIGRTLNIAEPTVHSHVESARRRLGARNRAHLAALSVSYGIVPAP